MSSGRNRPYGPGTLGDIYSGGAPGRAAAVQRPGYTGSGVNELAAFYTQQRRMNPAFRAPQGFEWKGDHYERDTHGLFSDSVGLAGSEKYTNTFVNGGLLVNKVKLLKWFGL